MTPEELQVISVDLADPKASVLLLRLHGKLMLDELRSLQQQHDRLWDIVRYLRAEAQDADLITGEEYEQLAGDATSKSRLESFDDMRKHVTQLARACGCLEPDEYGRPSCDPPCIPCRYSAASGRVAQE